MLREELNVKQVEYTQQADQYITYTVLPDLKRLGPRLGKRLPALKAALAKADAAELLARLERDEQVTFDCPTARSRSTRKICKSACKPSPAGPRRKAPRRGRAFDRIDAPNLW